VRARRTFKRTGSIGQKFNDCVNRKGCLENSLCGGAPCRSKLCRNCRDRECGKLCASYERELCQTRETPPYVCNNCAKRNRCTLEKAFYDARGAQSEYEGLRHDARAGFDLSESEASRLDSIVSPLIKQGQSLHHICANNAGKLMLSERTLYNYIDAGIFTARNIDLRRKVRFKRRKSRPAPKADPRCAVGRTYADYLAFMEANPDIPVVEMDTVHGSNKEGKALLTLHFVSSNFMLAILIDSLRACDVNAAIARLRSDLGCDLFAKLFPVLLTDRGSEFSDPKPIEFDEEGEGRTRVFYCEPQQSQQKGAAEKNHTLIRYVIPKGTPLDGYTKDDIGLMMNHINSYGRGILNNRAPMEIFSFIHGDDALKKLGAALILPDKIILRPELLKH
jgi:IS30 family transposase